MTPLDVPIFHQRSDVDCSIAAAKMVLDYYQDEVDYNELENAFISDLDSTRRPHLQSAAIFFAQRGYQVLLQHYDSVLVDSAARGLDWDDRNMVTDWLKKTLHNTTSEYRRLKSELSLRFLLSGGNLRIEIPDIALLSNKLAIGVPSIVCIELRSIRGNPNLNGNHYCVVIGENKDTFSINDPAPSSASKYDVPKDLLRYAWYRTGAYTMIVERKK